MLFLVLYGSKGVFLRFIRALGIYLALHSFKGYQCNARAVNYRERSISLELGSSLLRFAIPRQGLRPR